MRIDRRNFLKTAGSAALAGLVRPLQSLGQSQDPGPPRSRQIVVFFDPTFPAGELGSLEKESFLKAFDGFEVLFYGVDDLKAHLNAASHDLFVNPYGSQFPKDAYVTISNFLKTGGNWVNLGGIPFSVPVDKEGTAWRKEIRQTEYHKNLGITQAFPVSTRTVVSYEVGEGFDDEKNFLHEFTAEKVYECYVRFTVTKDFPEEDGSSGARDAVLRPLVLGVNEKGRSVTAPFIQIDRIQGEFSGGRWVLANFKGTISPRAIRTLAEIAMQSSMELSVRPSFACYRGGEMPSFTVQFRRPKGGVETIIAGGCQLQIQDEKRKTIETLNVDLRGEGSVATGFVDSRTQKEAYVPGLYRVLATARVRSVSSNKSYSIVFRTGFWVYDEELISSGAPVSINEDYLLKDGRPYPVTGTTYMASDVHRKFLFEPNPYVWERDFKAMKEAGVNMVRTGIWTGWKNFMLDFGAPNEPAFRAMDAFILTARKFDIPVIFTFFAFLPESWGGENAYLDPRAVNAQKEFVLAFVQRYRMVNGILWDFINEPSFCSPKHLWSCRPNYDAYESASWNDWLKKQYPYKTEQEQSTHLQELYRAAAGEALDLPRLEEFEDVNIFDDRHPIKTIDYRLFAQTMFARWAGQLSSLVRGNGNKNQLTTVGQDEGGTYDSPSPQFFSDAVDFTCIHNWWLNDDLLWDSVVTKVAGKPNLVEETGVMFYEKMDGSPWRTEEEARNLLERKLAISLGSGGAGFLEWIWNTNPYMKSDNEAAIGLLRVDGTEKPELEPLVAYSRFFEAHANLMRGRKPEDVVMVIPHSQMFSTRNFATEATQRCVRAMYYHCNVMMSAVSEYSVGRLKNVPKLVVVPSPRTISQKAWDALLRLADSGATILISGIIDTDDHWIDRSRSKEFGVDVTSKPVAEEEFLEIDGTEYALSYRGNKIQQIEKVVVANKRVPETMVHPRHKGRILWSPLPVEVSETVEPTVALYQYALREAKVNPLYSLKGNDPSILILSHILEETILYTFVSETDRDTAVHVTDRESGAVFAVSVPAQRSVLMFVNRKDGKILGKLG